MLRGRDVSISNGSGRESSRLLGVWASRRETSSGHPLNKANKTAELDRKKRGNVARRSLSLSVRKGRRRSLGLVRIPPPSPGPPDPKAETHNSLTWYWWILEFFPHSYYDPVFKRAKWRIPLGARRFIPEGSVLHATVNEKRWLDQSYMPSNLPGSSDTEPRNPCAF